ncbi:MAG: hypothetical protein ACFFCM_16355 [Promethearchaeota archaeon]
MNEELKNFLIEFFASSELNRLHENYGGGRIFSDPLIGVADGADPIYQKYKEVVGPEHYTPLEFWTAEGKEILPASKLRVISIVLPFSNEIREGSKNIIDLKRLKLPAEIYSVARNYANAFKKEICLQVIKFLEKKGFNGIAGLISKKFTIIMKGRFYSNWSERHSAFAAGLGTFSLHEALITEVGCNVRFGSIITDAPFEVTPRKSEDPYGNCLFFAKGTCKKCVEKCPAGAISEKGHDKTKCSFYLQKISRQVNSRIGSILKPHSRMINGVVRRTAPPTGCAFCQFGVPCMDKNPMASLKE